MADLKTNYVDDVLDASVNTKRKYNMIQNADGTVSFDDVTTYTQNGDSFGAKDVNDTNTAVNELNNNLNGFSFSTQDGVNGYIKDGTFNPFKSAPTLVGTYSGNQTIDVSSVVGANDTVDNFIIELLHSDTVNTSIPSTSIGYALINGTTVTKQLNGNVLSINGMTQTLNLVFIDGSASFEKTQTLTYNLWHY